MPQAQRSPVRTRKHADKKEKKFIFTATCAAGLEELVAAEMAECGAENLATAPGAVTWSAGTLESGYRACLWSRCASRILLEIARFDAPNPDAVYEGASAVLWDEHLAINKKFAVTCTQANSPIGHTQFAALKVKDAVVDQFRRRFGRRPDVDADRPDLRLHLHLQGTGARLAVDLSGESLHRRGYRVAAGPAPLKESLAAALVRLSGWPDHVEEEPVLLDPMCGSGTLLIEAALMLAKSAPGLARKHFGFMGWAGHEHGLWERLTAEALEREAEADPQNLPRFIGYDADPRAVAAAQKNVIAAGLRDAVVIHQRELAHLKSPGARGCILTNPPYGERLADKETARWLYRALGRRYREEFPGWRLAFFTANPEFADAPGVVWEAEHQLRNGPLKCRLLVGHESRPAPPEPKSAVEIWQPKLLPEGHPGMDFGNRLRKNFAGLAEWLERERILCFRLYDADMPEFKFAVDCYGEWAQVQEYAAPATVEADRAGARRQAALAALRETLALPHSRLFVKTRRRQKGEDQYRKKEAATGKLYEAREGDARLLVNFTDYLDTGLFLDHRPMRRRIREIAAGKTFLNLFGYTGAATVFAALGGARNTTTVDASAAYLDRAAANLALNGFGGPLHRLVQADCLQWLADNEERFDLIFVDPPTFSNTKSNRGGAADREERDGFKKGGRPGEGPGKNGAEAFQKTFDIQRDHARLLRLVMAHLSEGGLALFSTNFRKFQLDAGIAEQFDASEISADTIPPDFRRNQKIHRAWELRRR